MNGRSCMLLVGCAAWFLISRPGEAAGQPSAGAEIYRQQCASCHGAKGEGVADKYDEPLYGQRSVESLTRLIEKTMPEDQPEACVGAEAREVAAYIHDAFYSAEARARNHPAKIDFAHLTNRQYRESVADLIGSFGARRQAATAGGLRAEYFQSKGMNKKERRVLERQDREVDFDFADASPADGITADQFSIAWAGSLLAPDTGTYEFRLRTPNGARLYLNADLRAGDSNRRDDSDARRQPALIDLWVSSGGEVREGAARVFLLGGRSYPLRVDFFKFKESKASIRLEWRPPEGVWSVLPAEHLSPEPSSAVAVVATPFPPDDGSLGYERGTAVSRSWQEATARGAVEAANVVVARLTALSGVGEGASNRMERLKEFCATFAERAFRRPLTPELRRTHVDRQFEGDPVPETAVKRSVMLALASPRFLYPELGGPPDDRTVAARLALALWDSLPDAALLEAADRGGLREPAQVREQAERMMADPRARAKLRDFFHHWLGVKEASEISKDREAYPGFDEAMVADLRESLDLFVDGVIWGETSDYRQLLLANHLFLNRRLARFYGAPQPDGPQGEGEGVGGSGGEEDEGFVRVSFDPQRRVGVFTHPYLLAQYSYHRSTSPIHRGVFLTRNVLGRFLKPPPMAIQFMDDRFDPSLTMREKVTELTRNEACMACHATINPLGFSLEHYDAVGRYRTEDNRKRVNAESDYTTTDGEVLRLRGPRDVAEHAAESPEARAAFVRQLFQHTVRQAPSAYGPEAFPRLDAGFVASGHHVRRLLTEIAVSTSLHGVNASPRSNP